MDITFYWGGGGLGGMWVVEPLLGSLSMAGVGDEVGLQRSLSPLLCLMRPCVQLRSNYNYRPALCYSGFGATRTPFQCCVGNIHARPE